MIAKWSVEALTHTVWVKLHLRHTTEGQLLSQAAYLPPFHVFRRVFINVIPRSAVERNVFFSAGRDLESDSIDEVGRARIYPVQMGVRKQVSWEDWVDAVGR